MVRGVIEGYTGIFSGLGFGGSLRLLSSEAWSMEFRFRV